VTKAAKEHVLAEFLCDAFTREEFVRFLRTNRRTARLVNELALHPVPADFFLDAVLLLSRHGLVDAGLFAMVASERPDRTAELVDLRRAILGDAGTPLPQAMLASSGADSEVEVRVKLPLGELTYEKFTALLGALRTVADDPQMIVVHLKAGSTIVRVWTTLASFHLLEGMRGQSTSEIPLVQAVSLRRAAPWARRPEIEGSNAPPPRPGPLIHPDFTNTSDLELLQGWRRSKAAMGKELFVRHKTAVTNLFRRNVRSKDDIPDLVQKTFLACVTAKKDPQITGSVRGYILGIAFFTMTRFFREARNAPTFGLDGALETTLASVEPDPEYLLTLNDEQRLLMKAIRRLKIEFQVVFELNYWEGISCDEIAEILSIPQGTVRSRLQNGRAALEKKLADLADSTELLAATTMSVHSWQQAIQAWIAAHPLPSRRSRTK
jgi:RNA polymerase sigma-70 factor (ECF subfamily)